MSLAIFDLDNTLLGGDSDYLWGQFLIEKGILDRASYEARNLAFYEDYKAGRLDIHAFLAFQLRPLAEHDVATLHAWRSEFLERAIEPIVLPAARALIEHHRHRGDRLLIITATNRFITGPIAQALGIDNLLATEPGFDGNRYTGRPVDIPCFQDGKVIRLERWLAQTGCSLEDSWFYSDSMNDLPLLERVSHPVAVDPDERLAAHARGRGWPIISLR